MYFVIYGTYVRFKQNGVIVERPVGTLIKAERLTYGPEKVIVGRYEMTEYIAREHYPILRTIDHEYVHYPFYQKGFTHDTI